MFSQESDDANAMRRRQMARLRSVLEKSLSAYAIAASAAGVSVLAMTESAGARVVYTPANTNIPLNNGGPVALDLNHDGIADFFLFNDSYFACCGQLRLQVAVGCATVALSKSSVTCRYQANEIWGQGVASGRFASALPRDFTVGPSKAYFQQAKKWRGSFVRGPAAGMASRFNGYYWSSATGGQWLGSNRRFLGFRFTIGGRIHYGWARLSVTLIPPTTDRRIYAVLTGYAYETIPNKPIVTGKTNGPDVITLEPATLGHLAQGASAIPAWRKKK